MKKTLETLDLIFYGVLMFVIGFVCTTVLIYIGTKIYDRYEEYTYDRDAERYTLEDWKICQTSYLYKDTALKTNDDGDIKLAVGVSVLLEGTSIDCSPDFQRSRQRYLFDTGKLNMESIKFK